MAKSIATALLPLQHPGGEERLGAAGGQSAWVSEAMALFLS